MVFPESQYIEAHNYAVTMARKINHWYGIEKMKEYGKTVYSVKMIPNDPQKRCGWEMRCEAISPDSPFYEKSPSE